MLFRSVLWNAGLQLSTGAWWCLALSAIAVATPNSNRLGSQLLEFCRGRSVASAYVAGAAIAVVLSLVLVNTARDSFSAFIYFNF